MPSAPMSLCWDALDACHLAWPGAVAVIDTPTRARTIVLEALAREILAADGRVLWVGSPRVTRPLADLPLSECRLDARPARLERGDVPWPAVPDTALDPVYLASVREIESSGTHSTPNPDGSDRCIGTAQLTLVTGHAADLTARVPATFRVLYGFATHLTRTPRPAVVILEDWEALLTGHARELLRQLLIDLTQRGIARVVLATSSPSRWQAPADHLLPMLLQPLVLDASATLPTGWSPAPPVPSGMVQVFGAHRSRGGWRAAVVPPSSLAVSSRIEEHA